VRAVRGRDGSPVLTDVDEPPGQGELLTMKASGICGSDMEYLHYGTSKILGHELVGFRADGTAVAVEGLYGCGQCEPCLEGRFNLCRDAISNALGSGLDGGMVEQFRAPSARLVELPAGLAPEDGALVEPAAGSWHGVRMGGGAAGKRVAVVGGGSFGLLAAAAAQAQGAEQVDMEVRHPHQHEVRERLGAGETDGKYDLVIEAAGSPSALQRCIKLVRFGGTIVVLGFHPGNIELPFWPLLTKEVTLIPTIGYCEHEGGRDMQQAAEMLAGRPEIAEAVITHRFPLEDAPEAFRVANDRAKGAIKVVVEVG